MRQAGASSGLTAAHPERCRGRPQARRAAYRRLHREPDPQPHPWRAQTRRPSGNGRDLRARPQYAASPEPRGPQPAGKSVRSRPQLRLATPALQYLSTTVSVRDATAVAPKTPQPNRLAGFGTLKINTLPWARVPRRQDTGRSTLSRRCASAGSHAGLQTRDRTMRTFTVQVGQASPPSLARWNKQRQRVPRRRGGFGRAEPAAPSERRMTASFCRDLGRVAAIAELV